MKVREDSVRGIMGILLEKCQEECREECQESFQNQSQDCRGIVTLDVVLKISNI